MFVLKMVLLESSCIGKWLYWKMVVLENGCMENGCIGKWFYWKVVVLENDFIGKCLQG